MESHYAFRPYSRNRCLLILSSFFVAGTVFCANPVPAAQSEKQEAAEIKQLETIEWQFRRDDDELASKAIEKILIEKKLSPWALLTARAMLAGHYRDDGDLKKAKELVKDYNEIGKLKNEGRQDTSTAWLKCYLEYAHIEALSGKASEGLKLLSYAEGRSESIDSALIDIKYGEILASDILNQPEKSAEYYKKANVVCDAEIKKLTELSAGQAKADVAQPIAEWRKLKAHIKELVTGLEGKLLGKEYGSGYGDYYMTLTLMQLGRYENAQKYAAKLAKENPKSIYGEAGKYYYACCTLKIPESRKSSRLDAGLEEGIKELKAFIKENPTGLYRGEAMMALGKIEIEENWDIQASSRFYSDALKYFREARDKKNALGLYAVPDKVKTVSKPAGPITSLDKWNRTVRRTPGAKEIITPETAPWYLSESEREALFMVGFFLFIEGKFPEAKEAWKDLKQIDSNIAALDAKNYPNAMNRLKSACDWGYIVFPIDEKRYLKGKNELRLAYAELNYVLEKFDDSRKFYKHILNDSKSTEPEKAIAYIGLGIYSDMTIHPKSKEERVQEAEAYFGRAIELGKRTPIYGNALIRMGCYMKASTETSELGDKYFHEYLKNFPKGRYADKARFKLASSYIIHGKKTEAEKYIADIRTSSPNSEYLKAIDGLEKTINEMKNKDKKREGGI